MTDFEIIKQYPNLFGEPPFDVHQTLIGFGFECGDGWLPILEELFKKINDVVEQNNLTDFRIVQVKEKFGGLRIYTNYTNKEIDELIMEAENKAISTCDVCGKEGKLRRNGWMSVRCDEHE